MGAGGLIAPRAGGRRRGSDGNTVAAELSTHLICGNHGARKTPAIKVRPACHARFRIHFTSTYLSCINQVEGRLGRLIRRGMHESVQAPEGDIRAWTDQWNADPLLFVRANTLGESREAP
ncbi:hypothetical protein [Sinosporangium siamense]|uniref:Transposase n=1 Tax=Sinosporangium siamense TaxID=1367973 RepID=A0A919RNI7_9ACTN|nr:hypothetical protein [Sinosporangium siamense]GII96818.1 hypothetical protein Ssi02_70490 [Sinosporangium siamense]